MVTHVAPAQDVVLFVPHRLDAELADDPLSNLVEVAWRRGVVVASGGIAS